MVQSLAELRNTRIETLIREYDREAAKVVPSPALYRDEIARRYATRQSAEITQISRQIRTMTEVITFLTVVNVVAVLANLLT